MPTSLCRLLGLGGLALMGVTWKLWTPQEVFPRVPLLYWAPPQGFDWAALVITVVGLLGLIVITSRPGRTIAAIITACGYALLFLSDQHRLQPWAWQFFLLAILIALADDRTIVTGWRWQVISIYVYSALSKFDVAFVENWGQIFSRLFAPKMASWQVPSNSWSQVYFEHVLPWSLPVGELLVAILLMLPRTRRYGLCGSWLMHLGLLGILGPLGLNHSWGVLGWNLFFLAQNFLLWWEWPPAAESVDAPTEIVSLWRQRLTRGYVAVVLAYPLLYPIGLLDAWLGWAVYAPPFQEATLGFEPQALAELQGPVREGLLPNSYIVSKEPQWHPILSMDQWSQRTLGVPCYPSLRFEIAVSLAVWRSNANKNFYVHRYHRRSRWSSKYQGLYMEPTFFTRDDLWNYAAGFWFNAYPESIYHRE